MSEKAYELATFAGGCFWCMVKPFDELPGIQKVLSGYAGGHVENPTYEQVKTGTSGHLEVVQITFDPSIFPYQKLLDLYYHKLIQLMTADNFSIVVHLTAQQFFIIMKHKKSLQKNQSKL